MAKAANEYKTLVKKRDRATAQAKAFMVILEKAWDDYERATSVLIAAGLDTIEKACRGQDEALEGLIEAEVNYSLALARAAQLHQDAFAAYVAD